MKQVDVIVCGGGMVGLPLALALGKGGLKVAVVDALPPATTVRSRNSTAGFRRWPMPPCACCGRWACGRIWQPQAQPIHEILVSDGAVGRAASPFSLHFDAEEVGADSSGPYRGEPAHPRRALCGRRSARRI